MKLTEAQQHMLIRVCRTNGGGIHAGFSESNSDTKFLRQLERMGLVQGKNGRPSYAVHTRKGLELFRQIQQTESPTHE